MESVFEAILTNAGLAGAVLIVCGYALLRKDREVRDLQSAAVTREHEMAGRIEKLTAEFTGKLTVLADARTADMARVLSEEREGSERATDTMLKVNVTLTEILGVLAEVRADVRRRSPTMPPERH